MKFFRKLFGWAQKGVSIQEEADTIMRVWPSAKATLNKALATAAQTDINVLLLVRALDSIERLMHRTTT